MNESQTTSKRFSKKHTIIILLLSILIVLAIFLAWMYTGQLNDTKRSLFKTLRLPVALVETQHITGKLYFGKLELTEKLAGEQTGVNVDRQEVLARLIDLVKIEKIAKKLNVEVSEQDLDTALTVVISQIPGADQSALEKELTEKYGLSIKTFKDEILRDTVLREKLSLWFNSQESLNQDSYNTARDIVKQLDNGADFEELARKFDEDPASQSFGGDSGFIPVGDLLPEFKAVVSGSAIGEHFLVPSRYGIHIIKIAAIEGEGDDTSYNLMQIFIQSDNFTSWLAIEQAKIKHVTLL